jgi:hypothetical protein
MSDVCQGNENKSFVGGIWGECPACHVGSLQAGITMPPDHAYDAMTDDDLEDWCGTHGYWECCHCGWRSDQ